MLKVTHVNIGTVVVACSPENPTFHADNGHWYLSQGIDRTNGVQVIQNSLPNGLTQAEQKEL